MAASGSRGRDQASAIGAGADTLDTLANPNLANLTAAELVVLLQRCDCSGSDFDDVALELSVRERKLAKAQARALEAKAIVAGLRDQIHALEELGPAGNALDLVPAVKIQDGVCFDAGIKATPAEVAVDNKEKGKVAVGCPQPAGASGVAGFEDRYSGERSMTSSSSRTRRGRRSRARGGDRARGGARAAAPDAPELNPEFATMPAADLIAHLNRYRRPEDFANAAHVLATRERNLVDSQALLRRVDGVMDGVRDEISRHERNALELRAQINRAAETEARLRARIQSLLELRGANAVRHGSDPTASEIGIGVHDLTLADRDDEGEVGDDVPIRHSPLRICAAPPVPGLTSQQAEKIAEARAMQAGESSKTFSACSNEEDAESSQN